LDQTTLKKMLRYDSLTGEFRWNVGTHKHRRAGALSSAGYIKIRMQGKDYQAHRLAVLYMKGAFPTQDVDHMNCNRSDNRWINLRVVPRQINAHNRAGANRNNRSGWAGVYCFRGTRWASQITTPQKKKQHLGVFSTPEEAHLMYLMAKEIYFGHY
jgi:hypothetical protein